jgi:hypothetical protein
MTSDGDRVLERAASTPFARAGVQELAEQVGADALRQALSLAMAKYHVHTASVLAAALIVRGETLEPDILCELLPNLESSGYLAQFARAAGEREGEVLVRLLVEEQLSFDCSAVVCLFASRSRAAQPDGPCRPRLVAQVRKLSRTRGALPQTLLIGAAAERLGDPYLSQLAANAIALSRQMPRYVEEVIEQGSRPLLDALPERGAPHLVTGYTIKQAAPMVGRNDPCPCGSGRKYKKCCASKAETGRSLEPVIDPGVLTRRQVAKLGPWHLASLDCARLQTPVLLEAFRTLSGRHCWTAAERFVDEVQTRSDLPHDDHEGWREDLVFEAAVVGAKEVVLRQWSLLSEETRSPSLQLDVDFAKGAPDLLQRVEQAAHAALAVEPENPGPSVELAFTLLRHLPALGIFCARGALGERRLLDSEHLLQTMGEARDTAGLPPTEPWWEMFDAMVEEGVPQQHDARRRAESDALRASLQEARSAAASTERELRELRAKLATLDDSKALVSANAPIDPPNDRGASSRVRHVPEGPPALNADPGASDEQKLERRRLRVRIEELQRVVAQGQDERRDLRRRLADLTAGSQQSSRRSSAVSHGNPELAEDAPPQGELESAGAPVDRPRRILVPHFSDHAAKALLALSPSAAELVLATVAALAAGAENTWGGVKALKKTASTLSARAGIHHRILFGVSDSTLQVRDVVHRRELDGAVDRLR